MNHGGRPSSRKARAKLTTSEGMMRYMYRSANSHILLGMVLLGQERHRMSIGEVVRFYREKTGDQRADSLLYSEISKIRCYFNLAIESENSAG